MEPAAEIEYRLRDTKLTPQSLKQQALDGLEIDGRRPQVSYCARRAVPLTAAPCFRSRSRA
jgi:hypothetical protein